MMDLSETPLYSAPVHESLSARIERLRWQRAATPDEVREALANAAAHAARQARRRVIVFVPLVVAAAGCYITGLRGVLTNAESPIYGALLLGFLALYGLAWVMAPPESNILDLAPALRDTRALGPLVEALAYPELRGLSERALTRLLPQLRPGDGDRLTPTQRTALYGSLDSGQSDFVLAALQALEQIGDMAALPYIRRLAQRAVRSGDDRRLRAAAEDALVRVAECARLHHKRRMLMRACDAPTDPLPRAAPAPTELLPRPAASPSGPPK